MLIKERVPYVRATWYIKVIYNNSTINPTSTTTGKQQTQQAQQQDWTDEWTNTLITHLYSQIKEFIQLSYTTTTTTTSGTTSSNMVVDPLAILTSDSSGSDQSEVYTLNKCKQALTYIVKLISWNYYEGLL